MQPTKSNLLARILLVLVFCQIVTARIHKLEIRDDKRRFVSLSSFGFFKGGILRVNLINFKSTPFYENAVYGFSLDRMLRDAMNPYLDNHQEKCLLYGNSFIKSDLESKDDTAIIYFIMDLKNSSLKVNCTSNIREVYIYKDIDVYTKSAYSSEKFSDTALFPRRKRANFDDDDDADSGELDLKPVQCSRVKLPMEMEVINGERYYNASFAMYVATKKDEGLYNLYFHNCPNYRGDQVSLDYTIQISETNVHNFLSAGEMPLPSLYFIMALLFFFSGCFWVIILRRSKQTVYKIHYLMAVLVFLKSLSLLFHGINFHFIQTKGEHVAAWAILYYITHLLKGALLFITIVLIGTGWTFIKHILADRDKKLFMIVISLQVLANVAEIIIEESEEGDIEHKTWRDIFILVDLLCCGAIMFPVVWSIRHLQEAAHTDGKAAINLRKLKLFRHFYIMILCYIYFTRIVYFLKIIVPFQFEWLDEMFREIATHIFFVLTGYKFRPASTNPYFMLTTDETEQDDDDDMDVVLFSSVSGGSGVTEGLSKVSKVTKVIRPTTSEVPSTQEERDSLFSKRESSHEYD